jgi:hypothetical protein
MDFTMPVIATYGNESDSIAKNAYYNKSRLITTNIIVAIHPNPSSVLFHKEISFLFKGAMSYLN